MHTCTDDNRIVAFTNSRPTKWKGRSDQTRPDTLTHHSGTACFLPSADRVRSPHAGPVYQWTSIEEIAVATDQGGNQAQAITVKEIEAETG